MDQYRYLGRFPPHKKVDKIVVSKTFYFDLDKAGVIVYLKVWDGDIEPYADLIELWVQIRGIPPKWSDWKTFHQATSTLGRLVEVD